ncbi:RIP metalloprotease RseP [Alicyclobacillus sp. TC]|uniref:RIP metalloprotease RseP n=1 Tax=Alicyclobacillus sp. TC TaxID=2606450 RepID=UPI001932EC5D|nr:RIP metalloprotease RseP [Alicyclobacillus sp. TC]QRF23691.1 RIP metalloprotease RseP [Alicyclobacillus sp. TC]
MWWLPLVHTLRSVIAIVLVFVVCIMLHEFGHFYVAKRNGVAVPVFAIGMGPKLFAFRKNGTEYSLRLFPIGGFVQLAGEMPQDAYFKKGEQLAFSLDSSGRMDAIGEPDSLPGRTVGTLVNLDLTKHMFITMETADGIRSYSVRPHARLQTSLRSSIPLVSPGEQMIGKSLWARASIILAGPVMNFLLAGVLFSLVFLHVGVPSSAPVVGAVLPNTPAAEAHLQQGDRIVQANGVPIQTWYDLKRVIVADKSNPPKPIPLLVERDGHQKWLLVRPELYQSTPIIGIDSTLTHNPFDAFAQGFKSVYTNSVNAIHLYAQVIERHQFNDLSGPVGIADVISQQAQTGVWQVMYITALLSLNLGLFNLIPIPALDGGRLLFMLVELIRGKAIDPRKEGLVHLVGFGLLMLLTVVITYRDVTRFF